jgi:uncharacterized membrane protein YsdA (DUF1294 family)
MTSLMLLGLFCTTLVITSLVTAGLYWWDKRAAAKSRPRISERTLHFWSLAGGWPGAHYARGRFRHKTQKQPFGMILWATTITNLLFWLAIFCI